jgi:hypothetical protein
VKFLTRILEDSCLRGPRDIPSILHSSKLLVKWEGDYRLRKRKSYKPKNQELNTRETQTKFPRTAAQRTAE